MSRRSTKHQHKAQKTQLPIIFRDPDATNKLLETILEAPNGKRMLSRLARTCRAFCEPALNVLWRDIDSFLPLLWQFPGHLLKKARKPGLGFVRAPTEEEWGTVLKYGQRVRHITYSEGSNAVHPSIFTMLEETRPCSYILPHLAELNWRAETAAGLARCSIYLNPELRSINLEIGSKFPQLDNFLADMSSRTQLTSFSFISPTNLPDSFTELLGRQLGLEKVVLVAPGALAPGVGRWIASLPELKMLRLDLTGRSMIAVEGFFDELRLRSGDSTPSSVGSTDSGVFSDDEVDFSLIRKSALRLTGDLRSKGSFAQLRKLHLTGEVSNIAVFIKHLTSPLTQIELVIEDPPDKADWHDLSTIINEKFEDSLQSLRVTATGTSRFMDLVRSTSRAEPASGRLTLKPFSYLANLTRLDIDLPESVIFTKADIESVAKACPNLAVLKLCPLASFPITTGAPMITLEMIAHLAASCKNLHTIASVIDARNASAELLVSRQTSSISLQRLHVGHSWINDSIQVSILLSHIAPRLEILKWFAEKNRPGFNEANARNWQRVAELLPHMQGIRLLERKLASTYKQPITAEKAVDAAISTTDQSIQVQPTMRNSSTQASSILVSQAIQVQPKYESILVSAIPSTADAGVGASTDHTDQAVDAVPAMASKVVDVKSTGLVMKSVRTLLTPFTFTSTSPHRPYTSLLFIPSIVGLFSLAYRFLIFYPLSLPARALRLAIARVHWKHADSLENSTQMSSAPSSPEPITESDIPLDELVVEVRH